jgi:hypothetical protein
MDAWMRSIDGNGHVSRPFALCYPLEWCGERDILLSVNPEDSDP